MSEEKYRQEQRGGSVVSLTAGEEAGRPLLALLKEQRIAIDQPCGGKGACGNCRVKFLEGAPEAAPEDRRWFTEGELKDGWRLACRAVIRGNCRVMVPGGQVDQIDSAVEFRELENGRSGTGGKAKKDMDGEKRRDPRNVAGLVDGYGLAVDIGTTTLAAALIALPEGKQLAAATCVNSQRAYGADVLSRILQANSGALSDMKEAVRKDLASLIGGICRDAGIPEDQIREIVIAGNTAMQHIFAGESCIGLGQAPFSPGDISLRHFSEGGADVTFLPGISAFVGADIVAGIYALGITEQEKPVLFLDLGTNGEMALWDGSRLFTASAAAGPAFEGGKLKNGAASVPGAIFRVRREQGRIVPLTIGDQRPVGICGTGAVSALGLLLEEGVLDRDGTMEEPWFSQGFPLWMLSQRERICLYQEDIREIQMAKSAICSGVEILMEEASVGADQIAAVYLAGGMGCALDEKEAEKIGLLPVGLSEKCRGVGNGAIGGGLRYLREWHAAGGISGVSEDQKAVDDRLRRISECAVLVTLAEHGKFQEKFLKNLSFPVRVESDNI